MQITTNPFPTLFTDRLALRALVPADREELMKLRSDEQVNKHLNRPPTTTLADADAFIQKIDAVMQHKQGVYWVISLKDKPVLIGTICYYNLLPEKDMAEIGYELSPDWQGKGLMQEAINEVIRYGFEVMGLKIITAMPHPANESSVKVLKRTGFVRDEGFEYASEEEADGLSVYVLIS
ncbi:MAG: GNAT family protein [Bacteroidota bacterium]